jgi:hypothetical protein
LGFVVGNSGIAVDREGENVKIPGIAVDLKDGAVGK